MTPYLLVMAVGIALCAREAWLDRTPRKPWVWARPELPFWAQKKTARERRRGALPIRGGS